jgi:hypothetical protein
MYSEGFHGFMWFLQVNGLALPSRQPKVFLMHHTLFFFLLLIMLRRQYSLVHRTGSLLYLFSFFSQTRDI